MGSKGFYVKCPPDIGERRSAAPPGLHPEASADALSQRNFPPLIPAENFSVCGKGHVLPINRKCVRISATPAFAALQQRKCGLWKTQTADPLGTGQASSGLNRPDMLCTKEGFAPLEPVAAEIRHQVAAAKGCCNLQCGSNRGRAPPAAPLEQAAAEIRRMNAAAIGCRLSLLRTQTCR